MNYAEVTKVFGIAMIGVIVIVIAIVTLAYGDTQSTENMYKTCVQFHEPAECQAK